MSPSARKDVFQAVGIRPVRPNLSKEEFYAKIEVFVEDALLLPIVQKNLLKIQVVG
jgi:hypothetical protein